MESRKKDNLFEKGKTGEGTLFSLKIDRRGKKPSFKKWKDRGSKTRVCIEDGKTGEAKQLFCFEHGKTGEAKQKNNFPRLSIFTAKQTHALPKHLL